MAEAPERIALYEETDRDGTYWVLADHEEHDPATQPSYVRLDRYDEAIRQRDVAVEALKTAKQVMESAILSSGPGDGFRHGIDSNHPAMRQITAAIAEAEGSDG